MKINLRLLLINLLLIFFCLYFVIKIFTFDFSYIFDLTLFLSLIVFFYWNKKANNKLPNVFYNLAIIFIILNILGYLIYIGDIKLYDFWLNKYFRFDNLIHFVGALTLVTYLYYYLLPHFNPKTKIQKNLFTLNIVFLILGLGAFHEIIELFGVLFFNAADKIGDYLNNALDLLYNFLGGIFAIIVIKLIDKKNKL